MTRLHGLPGVGVIWPRFAMTLALLVVVIGCICVAAAAQVHYGASGVR